MARDAAELREAVEQIIKGIKFEGWTKLFAPAFEVRHELEQLTIYFSMHQPCQLPGALPLFRMDIATEPYFSKAIAVHPAMTDLDINRLCRVAVQDSFTICMQRSVEFTPPEVPAGQQG